MRISQGNMGRLAIIGAGPVGIEAALEGLRRGWDVVVFEAGREVGSGMESWAHVGLFTPWSMMTGPRGEEAFQEEGRDLPPPEGSLTGRDFLDLYLRPIASGPEIEERVRTGHRVLGVARRDQRKPDGVGARGEAGDPFVLHLLDTAGRESLEEADAVLDCSGVLGRPNGLGPGGGSAAGEVTLSEAGERCGIIRRIPDLEGEDRRTFAGRRVLLLGAGHSAANALLALADLSVAEPGTRVTWAWRRAGAPYRPDPEDPLPLRREVEERAAALAAHPPPWLRLLPGHHLEALHVEAVGPAARLAGRVVLRDRQGGRRQEGTDVLLALLGYRPDTSLFRELQVHTCYATEGPMALASALLARGGADCMRQPATGSETLATTEPGFFVLGHKAYGRNPYFLLRDGYRQVALAFDLLEDRRRVRAAAAAQGGS